MVLRPINRRPQGFLDFFGLKSLGRNPEAFIDGVRNTVDLREWYLQTNSIEVVDTLTRTNANTNTGTSFTALPTLRVPDDRWWFVHCATMIVVMPPDAVISSPAIVARKTTVPGGYIECLVDARGVSTSTVGLTPGTALNIPTFGDPVNRWLAPGTQFGIAYGYGVFSTMAGGDTLRLNAHLRVTEAAS